MRKEVFLGEYKEAYEGQLYSKKLSGLAIYTMNNYSMSLAIIDLNSFEEFDIDKQMAYKTYNILNSIFKIAGIKKTYWGIIKTDDETYSLDLAEMLRKSIDFIEYFTKDKNVVRLPDLYSQAVSLDISQQSLSIDSNVYDLKGYNEKEKVKKYD